MAAAFAPGLLSPDRAQALYFVTDIFLVAGLVAIFARCAVALGWIGLIGFALALVGFLVIRTGTLMGVQTYSTGGALCLFGLAFIGARMPAEPPFPRLASILWMAALIIGVAGAFWPIMTWGVFVAGLVFALGFIAAGVPLMRGGAGLSAAPP
ncbi:MAG TPA: hypothetical protein VFE03_06470 [Caulobacteraceae bacterium]|jgi:hypothetical protein|nr:hypothetical protein [Caulobacteraceae bacterium]